MALPAPVVYYGDGSNSGSGTIIPPIGGAGFTSYGGGCLLDGVTDDSATLDAELTRIAGLGGGTIKLVSQTGIYINDVCQIGSYTNLDFSECPIKYGANASIRTDGATASTPSTNLPRLFSDATAGSTSFEIVIKGANVAPVVGDQWNLRGANNAAGITTSQTNGYVTSVSAPNGTTSYGARYVIGIDQPLEDTYPVRNTGSGYEQATGQPDYTYFTISLASPMTADVASGAFIVPVVQASRFSVGQYIFVSDNESAGEAVGVVDPNYIHQECNRVVGVDTNLNMILLERALDHSYTMSHKASLAALNPTIQAHIIMPKVKMVAQNTKQYPFRLNFAVDSSIVGGEIVPTLQGGVWVATRAQAIRIDRSYRCKVLNNSVTGSPTDGIYTSGQGYGIVAQGCTACEIAGNKTQNMRHGILLQAGASGNNIHDNIDTNCRISAFDFHGINARRNHLHDNKAVAGPLTADASSKAGIRLGNPSHIYGDFENTIENNEVIGFSNLPPRTNGTAVTGTGIDIITRSSGNVVQFNTVRKCDSGITALYNAGVIAPTLGGNEISYNEAIDCGTIGIRIDGGDGTSSANGPKGNNVFTDTTVIGNTLRQCTRQIDVANAGSILLSGNRVVKPITNTGIPAIKAAGITTLRAIGNDCNGANQGITIQNCPGAQIIDNLFTNLLQTRVFVDGGGNNGYVLENNSDLGTASPLYDTSGGSTGKIAKRPAGTATP